MENEIHEPQPIYGFKKNVTPEEYLEIDANSERKVEYRAGEVFVMQGASTNHNRIVMKVGRRAGNQLEGKGCEVLPSDMRVASPNFQSYNYPDITIVCGEIELRENVFDTLTNPTVIVEVVSKSSEADDYHRKFMYYKQIPALKEYVLIDSFREIGVNVFRRQSNNSWLTETYIRLEDNLVLQSVNITISLKDIYENITF